MPGWLKGWWRRRKAKQDRAEAAARGEVSFELLLWDGAGKRFGGVGACTPERLKRILMEMGEVAAEVATRPDQQESLGWTPPPAPAPEGEDPGRPCG